VALRFGHAALWFRMVRDPASILKIEGFVPEESKRSSLAGRSVLLVASPEMSASAPAGAMCARSEWEYSLRCLRTGGRDIHLGVVRVLSSGVAKLETNATKLTLGRGASTGISDANISRKQVEIRTFYALRL
jgi:hypothetical protein